MKKIKKFFIFVLCSILLLSIFGCGKKNEPQDNALPPAAVESEPVIDEEANKPLSLPVFNTMEESIFTYDKTDLSSAKRLHDGNRLIEYEQYNDDYYYIIWGSNRWSIYHITANSEPSLVVSPADRIDHLAVTDTTVFYISPTALYSVPVEGGEIKTLYTGKEIGYIEFIDAIDSNTLFLADTKANKDWDLNAEYTKINENGEFEISSVEYKHDKYYCYNVSQGTFKESSEEEYLTALKEKEYFDDSRFRVHHNFYYNGKPTGKNSVVVFDILTGSYKQFDNITYTPSVESNSPYFVRENEVLRLTPYEETTLCKANSNIVDFCFDNNGKLYFVSDNNLYLAEDNNGNNTLIQNVGNVTSIKYDYIREVSSWGICLQANNNEEVVCSYLSPYSDNTTPIPIENTLYPLNRSTMSYEEYFLKERLVFKSSVYDEWEISQNNIIDQKTGTIIFSAPAPIDAAYLTDYLYFYVSNGNLYRYHIDSGVNEIICDAQNAYSVTPLSSLCGSFSTHDEKPEKYFNTLGSYNSSDSTQRITDCYLLSNSVKRTMSEYSNFPSLLEIQGYHTQHTWNICKETDTLTPLTYNDYFSQERFFTRSDAIIELNGNKIIDKQNNTVIFEADSPIQQAAVSDYLIYYSCNNSLFRYYRLTQTTDYICSLEGYTHFSALTNMAGILYLPEKDGNVEVNYFDIYSQNIVNTTSERVKAIGTLRLSAAFVQLPEHFDYTPYDLQEYTVYEICERYIAKEELLGANKSAKLMREDLKIACP